MKKSRKGIPILTRKTVTVVFYNDLWTRVQMEALQKGVSASDIVNHVLMQFLDNECRWIGVQGR